MQIVIVFASFLIGFLCDGQDGAAWGLLIGCTVSILIEIWIVIDSLRGTKGKR